MDDAKNVNRLRRSLKSIEIGIKSRLERATELRKDQKNIGASLWSLILFFHRRAVLKYLLDADLKGFFEDLNRSSLTYYALLQAWHHKMDVPESRVNASTYEPLICSIAAGNLELLKNMNGLMPEAFGDYDSEELFTYTALLRKLATRNQAEIETSFNTFAKTCKDFFRYNGKIQALEGIVRKNNDLFNDGLQSYLASFRTISMEEAQEMDPGDEYLDLESLAYIQLAKHEGIPILVRHGMIPEELQDPKLAIPDSGYPKWPES